MTDFDLYEFYSIVKAQKIIFCYSGPVMQEGLEGISQTLRKKLQADEVEFAVEQAIFSIFIEEMQNILNYSAEKQTYHENETVVSLSCGIFLIGTNESGYFLYCGNQILTKDIPYLTEKIEEIRHMSKDDLKVLYRQRRRQPPDPGSKGAGLGLIEIARRSGTAIDYKFTKVSESYSFFSIFSSVEA